MDSLNFIWVYFLKKVENNISRRLVKSEQKIKGEEGVPFNAWKCWFKQLHWSFTVRFNRLYYANESCKLLRGRYIGSRVQLYLVGLIWLGQNYEKVSQWHRTWMFILFFCHVIWHRVGLPGGKVWGKGIA